jgi:hypothetical protein
MGKSIVFTSSVRVGLKQLVGIEPAMCCRETKED